MAKSPTIRARIEPELKAEVEKLFKELGLSTTEAINLFYRQVKLRNGLPFNVVMRLSENAHLLRYPHPSSLQRAYMYASLLGISSRSRACGMGIFHQPLK